MIDINILEPLLLVGMISYSKSIETKIFVLYSFIVKIITLNLYSKAKLYFELKLSKSKIFFLFLLANLLKLHGQFTKFKLLLSTNPRVTLKILAQLYM